MIEEGSHTYGRDPFSLPDDMDPRARAEAQRARARQATVPTLGELVAANAMNMVTSETGASMPAKLAARGDDGWEFDSDRDSEKAARLAGLVKDMDALCQDTLSKSVMSGEVCYAAHKIAEHWQAIRTITQGGHS